MIVVVEWEIVCEECDKVWYETGNCDTQNSVDEVVRQYENMKRIMKEEFSACSNCNHKERNGE